MKFKVLFICLLVFATGVGRTHAQTVRQHAKRQQARIGQGVKSGELTKAETINLEAKEKAIHQEIKTARADGSVSASERKEIRKDQRQTSRAIYRKKHNNRDRN